mgnify:FL=1
MKAPPGSLVVTRGIARFVEASSSTFLKGLLGGPYTTARTLGGVESMESSDVIDETSAAARARRRRHRGILCFEDHVERIAAGAAELRRGSKGASTSTDWVREAMLESARIGCDALDNGNGGGSTRVSTAGVIGAATPTTTTAGAPDALKLTWTLPPPPEEDGDDCGAPSSWSDLLHLHITPMPPRRVPPIVVIAPAASAVRSNPLVKDTAWISERASLEELMQKTSSTPGGAEEVLLIDDGGAILEGTQTNFFALNANGIIETAGDGVLEGTVRRLVLEVCEAEGIAYELRAPLLREHTSWQGAFIGSTSRLAMSINSIDDRSTGAVHTFKGGVHPTIERIERLVKERAALMCTPII